MEQRRAEVQGVHIGASALFRRQRSVLEQKGTVRCRYRCRGTGRVQWEVPVFGRFTLRQTEADRRQVHGRHCHFGE